MVKEVCRKYDIADSVYYNWKSKYSGMETSDVKRRKELEDENRRLKHMSVDISRAWINMMRELPIYKKRLSVILPMDLVSSLKY